MCALIVRGLGNDRTTPSGDMITRSSETNRRSDPSRTFSIVVVLPVSVSAVTRKASSPSAKHAARRRFPDVSPFAFPSPQHRWGVQNLYLQAAADMGVIGLAALLALLGSGLVAGVRWAVRAPPAGAAPALVPYSGS